MSKQKRFSGQQLRYWRRANKFTLRKLATALAIDRGRMITPVTVGNYERGVTEPLYNDVESMAAILSCDIHQLCEDAR